MKLFLIFDKFFVDSKKNEELSEMEGFFVLAENKTDALNKALKYLTDSSTTDLLLGIFDEDRLIYCHPERYRMDFPNENRKFFLVRELLT